MHRPAPTSMDYPGWSVISPKVGNPRGPVSAEEGIFAGLAASIHNSWFCIQWPDEENLKGQAKHSLASVCLYWQWFEKKSCVLCWFQTNLKMAILSKSGAYFAFLCEWFQKMDSRLMSTQGSQKGLGTNGKINVGIAGKLRRSWQALRRWWQASAVMRFPCKVWMFDPLVLSLT